VLWKVADGSRRLQESHRRLAEVSHTLARRAVVEDRLRIARELHDVVAHHMSVVAVQAGLARYVLRADPDTADAALGTVLDTSGEALDELRRVLELLRLGTDGADAGAVPGLAYLPELLHRVRAAGVPVDVEITGTRRPLPSGVELCAYRVIQEGLTNVLRHAAPAAARVGLHYGDGTLRVTVTDDGTRTPSRQPPGKGLMGMRERAMLYGGTVEAGPRPGGGFEVRLELPL
jgi:signal transduction histidine kinase